MCWVARSALQRSKKNGQSREMQAVADEGCRSPVHDRQMSIKCCRQTGKKAERQKDRKTEGRSITLEPYKPTHNERVDTGELSRTRVLTSSCFSDTFARRASTAVSTDGLLSQFAHSKERHSCPQTSQFSDM